MTELKALTAANAARWSKATLTRSFSVAAKRLVAPKIHYEAISKATGVPWFIIAVIHEREASQSWSGSLAQGDPWDKVSVHKPAGRGPFKSWEEAAVDALVNCDPYAARWKDWSAGGALTLLEQYNGLGYFHRGMPSPYVWAGTDQYTKGKYVADGKFDPEKVDAQLGCAGLRESGSETEPRRKRGCDQGRRRCLACPGGDLLGYPSREPPTSCAPNDLLIDRILHLDALAATAPSVLPISLATPLNECPLFKRYRMCSTSAGGQTLLLLRF